MQLYIADSVRSFQRFKYSPRLDGSPSGGKDPQPPRASIELFGERGQIDCPDPTFPGKALDPSVSPEDRNVEAEHLSFYRVIEQKLARGETEFLRQLILHLGDAPAICRDPLYLLDIELRGRPFRGTLVQP